jgi:4-amino-4-deoxy-L-arabinose transferase-like glycosyltransferase
MRSRLFLVGFVALAFRLAMGWAIPLGAFPGDPNCAPDEAAHVRIVRTLAAGSVPQWPAFHLPYAAYLPTSSLVQAGTLALLRPLDGPALYRYPLVHAGLEGYALARLGSVLLGVATAMLLALAAFEWTGSSGVALACGLAAALYPQLAFVGAYVNEDAYTAAAGSALVFLLARWVRLGEGNRGLASLGAGCALVLLGKANGFALLPATGLWVLWAFWRGRVSGAALARAAALGLAIAGPALAWNGWRNGGDFLGTATNRAFMAENPLAWKDARALDHPLPGFLEWFGKSAFGVFGNMNVPLPRPLYLAAAALLVLGCVMALRALPAAAGVGRRGVAWLGGTLLVNALLVFHYSWFVNFQAQGRYALLPIVLSTLVAVMGPALADGSRARRLWPALYVAFLLLAAAVSVRLLVERPCGG